MKIDSADYRLFPTTFLQNTVVSLDHSSFVTDEHDDTSVMAAMSRFFMDNFKLDIKVNDVRHFLSVSSDYADISYVFSPESTMLKVGRKDYTTFKASVMPNFYRLKDYVYSVLGVRAVETMHIRKLNLFPVQIGEKPTAAMWNSLREYLFKKEFLDVPVYPSSMKAPSNAVGGFDERSVVTKDTEYVIRTGVTQMQSRPDGYNMVLDISCITPRIEGGIIENEIETTALRLDKKLFDLFDAVISSSLREIMETQPIKEDSHV